MGVAVEIMGFVGLQGKGICVLVEVKKCEEDAESGGDCGNGV